MKTTPKHISFISLSVCALLVGITYTGLAIAKKDSSQSTVQQKEHVKEKRAAKRARKKQMKSELKAYKASLKSSNMSPDEKRKAIKMKKAELRKKNKQAAK